MSITGMAFQKNPDPILWCFLTDGTLLSMTYEREQDVVAWAKHPMETGSGTEAASTATEGTAAVAATYSFTYFSDNGYIYGVPIWDQTIATFTSGGAARNAGGGLVGLPYVDHPFSVGETVIITGTANYDGTYTVAYGTTENEIVIAETYTAETFDGTDTIIKVITGLPSLSEGGRMVRDSDGYMYYAHTWANDTGVTRVQDDGTIDYDFLTWPDTYQQAYALAISADSEYLYVFGYTPLVVSEIIKFNLASGAVVWTSSTSSGYQIAVDADGNAYGTKWGITTAQLNKYASTDGAATAMTNMDNLTYEVVVDDDLGIVIAGGTQYASTADAPAVAALYNLGVRTLDDTAGDTICVGTTYTAGGLTHTRTIGTGHVAVYDGYIYVLVAKTGGMEIHKLQWDGAQLNHVLNRDGPEHGCGIYVDLWGNIVVVNQDAPESHNDVLYFYDTDLVSLGNAENLPGMLGMWNSAVGGSWMQGNAIFDGHLGYDAISGEDADTVSGFGVNSVATIPGSTEDEVWMVVSRYINGSVVRYLEQMQPRLDSVTDQDDMWFVDSGLKYEGDPATIISGLDHLEGEEVVILADGAVAPRQTVTNGSVTLPEAASKVIVGLPFRWKLQPMRFDLTDAQGTTKGSLKRFAELVVSFYRTSGVEYGADMDSLFNVDFRTDEPYGSPPALFTGDKVLTCEGGFSVEDPIILTGDDPLPACISALIPRIEVTGR